MRHPSKFALAAGAAGLAWVLATTGACTRSALPLKRQSRGNGAAGSGSDDPKPNPDNGSGVAGSSCSTPRAVRGYRFDSTNRCTRQAENIGLGVRGAGKTTGVHACVVSPEGVLFVAFFHEDEVLCDEDWHRAEGPTWRSTLSRSEAADCSRLVNVLLVDKPKLGEPAATELARRLNPC